MLPIESLTETLARLAPHVTRTPMVRLADRRLIDAPVMMKLEALQESGSFKFRSAVNNLLTLGERRRQGVVSVSSGNHGIALAEAGRRLDTPVSIVVGRSGNRYRRERMIALGADVLIAETIAEAFDLAAQVVDRRGLSYVHPYDGEATIAATASLGLEWIDDCLASGGLPDAIVLPVGGGGLAAGVAHAFHLRSPATLVFTAEPFGAPTFKTALEEGRPTPVQLTPTVADSLGGPVMGELSFEICRRLVRETVLVAEEDIKAALSTIFTALRLYLEPSAAVALAAVRGPLRAQLVDKSVGILICGANIDVASFAALLPEGRK